MNYVFALLVTLAVGFAAWTGSPDHAAVVSGTVATATLDTKFGPGAVLPKVDSPATVEVAGIRYEGRVTGIVGNVATVDSMAPVGPAVVRFTDQYAMKLVSESALDQAKKSVELAIGLIGAMTLFLGLMKVVEAGGGLDLVARTIRPILVVLFPDVPARHPAMGAMVMNIAANVLGLGNAATPFGIRAMQELDSLNKHKGTATNAMVLFLAINTSGVAVLPTGMIAVRAALGAKNPASIFSTTLAASFVNTVVAVLAAKFLQRLFRGPPAEDDAPVHEPVRLSEFLPLGLATGAMFALVSWVYADDHATYWIIPGLVGGMIAFGIARRVKVYESFVEGAKDGFNSATRIIPYVVAILVAVGMFRASGAMELLVRGIGPFTNAIGIPPEVLPLALLRPLSGSGAFALTSDITKTYGPDSFIANLAGTMQGTTETTFYVLSVYFGAVGITKYRHAVPTGLASDFSGVLASVLFVTLLLGAA